MKKYVSLMVLFVVYNSCWAMELAKLSRKDDEKALLIAKLFNKYPKGYGKSDEDKENKVRDMQDFAKNKQYEDLYVQVKKYQEILEICDFMYNYEDSCKHHSVPELRQKVFTNLLYLYGDVQQYYAADSAFKFIDIWNQPLVKASNYKDIWRFDSPEEFHKYDKYQLNNLPEYKKYFLSEINKDNSFNILFFKLNKSDQLDLDDDSKVRAKYVFYWNESGRSEKLESYFSRKTINDLVLFLDPDTKVTRVQNFENLLNNCVNNLSALEDQKEGLEKFCQLSGRLKEHNNKRINNSLKGPSESEYFLLPLEEIFSTEIKYDIEFFNQLAQSNGIGASMIKFDDGEKLEKWQQFPETVRKKLENIDIKLKNTRRTFMEHAIIHGALLISFVTPDLITYYIDNIASTIGCGTTMATVVSVIASLGLNSQLGRRIFPYMYAKFNSHTSLVKTCIQQEKIKKHNSHGLLFELLFFTKNGLQIVCSFMGNKCLSFASLPIKIFGMAAHGLRIPLYYLIYLYMCEGDSRNDIYKASELKIKEAAK